MMKQVARTLARRKNTSKTSLITKGMYNAINYVVYIWFFTINETV